TDHRQVTFHAGDRYPIVTAAYVGSPTPATSGGAGGGSTPSGAFGHVPTPSGIVIADFNADNISDFAASAAGEDAVAVFLGTGGGKFGNSARFPVGKSPAAIASADVNRDGIADILTANSGSNDVSVLLGRGDGTFGTASQFPAGSRPVALAVADFNRD